MRTLIIVPTHNEAQNIVQILSQISNHVPEADIIVIDDASTDGTGHLVAQVTSANTHVRLVERDEKLGLGDAYLFAFRMGLADGYEAFVEIDADLSHDPAVLPTMLDVAAHGISVVIGSRYIPGGTVTGWPRRRLWLSRWANRYVAVALGLAINDATSGYRVYTSDALRKIGIDGVQASGYGFQIEMTYRAVRSGLGVVEIPIAFRDRIAGTSKMNSRIVFEAFRLVTVWGLRDIFSLASRPPPTRLSDQRRRLKMAVATISGRMTAPSGTSPVERFAAALLASDLPRLPTQYLDQTVEFIERRVVELPSITRLGVRAIGRTVDLLGMVLGKHRVLETITARPLPLLAEYPRLVRSLGYAYIWETWPSTAADGTPR